MMSWITGMERLRDVIDLRIWEVEWCYRSEECRGCVRLEIRGEKRLHDVTDQRKEEVAWCYRSEECRGWVMLEIRGEKRLLYVTVRGRGKWERLHAVIDWKKERFVADAPSRRKSSKLDIVKSANYIKYIQSRSDSHTVHTLALSFSTLVTPTSEHESKWRRCA